MSDLPEDPTPTMSRQARRFRRRHGHADGWYVSAKDYDAVRLALVDCHDAMVMQLKRESGEFHITAQTARYVWSNALARARKALGQED